MGKDIGIIYKHSKYQLWTLSINAPVLSYSAFKTSSSIELTIIYVPSVRDKKQTNSVLCYENYIQNNLGIKNNYNIQPFETRRKNYSIPTTSTPNNHEQRISSTSVNI